jgi:hypothetical protein
MMARSAARSTTGRIYDCIRSQSRFGRRFLADLREESIYRLLADSSPQNDVNAVEDLRARLRPQAANSLREE